MRGFYEYIVLLMENSLQKELSVFLFLIEHMHIVS